MGTFFRSFYRNMALTHSLSNGNVTTAWSAYVPQRSLHFGTLDPQKKMVAPFYCCTLFNIGLEKMLCGRSVTIEWLGAFRETKKHQSLRLQRT